MSTIKFHPSSQQLREFAAGVMEPTLALMVSAHCDLCPRCQHNLQQCMQELADEALYDTPSSSEEELALFANMMQDIIETPQSPPVFNSSQLSATASTLELDGKSFVLPRSLGKFANKTRGWKKLVGKLWQAQVDLGGDTRAEFIYMEKGGSVPEHTHRGNEWTLVINGEFEDGANHYETGDLILLDSEHTHTPVSNDPDGCLVFSIVDKPLHFTSGIARLLNPFSHLFFK